MAARQWPLAARPRRDVHQPQRAGDATAVALGGCAGRRSRRSTLRAVRCGARRAAGVREPGVRQARSTPDDDALLRDRHDIEGAQGRACPPHPGVGRSAAAHPDQRRAGRTRVQTRRPAPRADARVADRHRRRSAVAQRDRAEAADLAQPPVACGAADPHGDAPAPVATRRRLAGVRRGVRVDGAGHFEIASWLDDADRHNEVALGQPAGTTMLRWPGFVVRRQPDRVVDQALAGAGPRRMAPGLRRLCTIRAAIAARLVHSSGGAEPVACGA